MLSEEAHEELQFWAPEHAFPQCNYWSAQFLNFLFIFSLEIYSRGFF